MASKTISAQLTFLISAIIKNWTYPNDQELSLKDRAELVSQLKNLTKSPDSMDEAAKITDAFYKDKINKRLKSIDSNFSWIFIILQHELVSASRLHALLLDLAKEEHFSEKGIAKINQYFAETDDYGDNDDFITMSSSDLIDSLGRTKIFHIHPAKDEYKTFNVKKHTARTTPKSIKAENQANKIIKLKNH
ncbi:hypothetical protein [Lactobacillus rizhaonensis]|uniref:hypothetical protein n=1 Tax=Lactobacillus rizhaonensis TaxID=3082863 RepID=UPI0030C75343